MKHVTLATTGGVLALCMALGCGGKSADQTRIGGETNWMVSCGSDADCAVGSCLCNLCTIECSDTLGSCSAGPPGSRCTTSNLPTSCTTEVTLAPSGGICLSPKADDLPLRPSFKSLDATLETMARDLEAQPAADRPFLRYLSVANLDADFSDPLDDQSTPAAERIVRRVARGGLAVAKLSNSVSTALSVSIPSSVGDDAQLLERIDVRAYGWNRPVTVDAIWYSDAWEAIVAHSALAVEYHGPAANRLKTLTGARVPWLFADDFVSAAASGLMYYALLGIPDTLRVLDEVLEPDDNTALGAAFDTSGISLGTRIVVRRTFRDGRSYWRAFDFGMKNMSAATLPDSSDFGPGATEVIYQLPNGLNAFFVGNGSGERAEESPLSPQTVSDPAQPDRVLRNAVSCFGCHNSGAIDFVDQFRSGGFDALLSPDLSADERARLLALYPEDPARLVALARADSQRYANALESAGVASGSPDPIERIVLDFQRDVSAARAAGELFVTPEALAANAALLGYPLNMLGSYAARVPRATFSKNYLTSLCTVQRESENQPVDCP